MDNAYHFIHDNKFCFVLIKSGWDACRAPGTLLDILGTRPSRFAKPGRSGYLEKKCPEEAKQYLRLQRRRQSTRNTATMKKHQKEKRIPATTCRGTAPARSARGPDFFMSATWIKKNFERKGRSVLPPPPHKHRTIGCFGRTIRHLFALLICRTLFVLSETPPANGHSACGTVGRNDRQSQARQHEQPGAGWPPGETPATPAPVAGAPIVCIR